MSNQLTLTVYFSKPGDVRKNTREKTWKMDLPVTAVTDPIQDLLLTLIPENEHGARLDSYSYEYPIEKDFLTNEDLPGIVKAVNSKLQQKIEESLKKEQERKERKIQERNKEIGNCKENIRFVFENELPLPNKEDYGILFRTTTFWNGTIGYNYFEPYGFDEFKDDLNLTDKEWEKFKNKLKLDYTQKEDRAVRESNEKEAKEKAEKEAREKAKKEFVANWAETNGSGRLKAQLHMGYDGLTLFYQEKLRFDFPDLDVKLLESAENFDMVKNPEIEQLSVETKAARCLVHLEIADSMNTAKFMTRIAYQDVEDDDDDEYGSGEKTRIYYVVVSGYRFGPKNIFPKEYTVAIQL